MNIRLVIVDDDLMFAQLLKNFINENSEIEVVYLAKSGAQFFEKLNELKKPPHVILLDLRMKNGSGLEVLERLSEMDHEMHTIVVSGYYEPSYLGQMLKLGCDAFLSKEVDPKELIQIIHAVREYGHYFTQAQIHSLRDQISFKSPELHINPNDSLSERELEVLQLLGQQLTTKEIGAKLFISPKTVEMHKGNLLLKTGTKNSVGLIIYAVQKKLLNPDDLVVLI